MSLHENFEEGDDGTDTSVSFTVESLSGLRDFHDEQEIIKKLCDSSEKEKAEDKLLENDLSKFFPEDWQISQFWYDKETTKTLVKEVNRVMASNYNNNCQMDKVACISCPSLFRCCTTLKNVHLYEYDRRFQVFGASYFFYDYNCPYELPDEQVNSYSLIILDPPFLSDECLQKMSFTVKKLAKPNAKIILCTALKMEKEAERHLGLKKTTFIPRHCSNGIKLSCEFASFCNYAFGID